MKVKDLIEELKKFNDNTEVTIWADHGQYDFSVYQAEEAFIHKEEWKNHHCTPAQPRPHRGQERSGDPVCLAAFMGPYGA